MHPPITWRPDGALPGFEAAALSFPADYDGPVTATLIRRRAGAPAGRAVLYLHGFNDYFFQAHMAEAYLAQGYSFYALDLRKYGRSLRPGQHPNFCQDVREYFAEIDAAIGVIDAEEGRPWLLLNGHSTGGLIAALYAHEGGRKQRIGALFLNSPFFDFNTGQLGRRVLIPAVARIGKVQPFLPVSGLSPLYGMSIHRSHHGEWEFNLEWKPIAGFPALAGWGRAIHLAQRQAAAGLGVACPILLMHSARSITGTRWSEAFQSADAVLDISDMLRVGPRLGGRVRLVSIEGGLHDLMLSRPAVREQVFAELFGWLGDTVTG